MAAAARGASSLLGTSDDEAAPAPATLCDLPDALLLQVLGRVSAGTAGFRGTLSCAAGGGTWP